MVKEKSFNPAPLGLMGFGLTTVLLNLVNSGILSSGALGIVLPMGIFYGGLAQIIAGLLEAKNKNTFGTVAFTSYGLFWWSFVAMKMLPPLGLAPEPSALAVSAFLLAWGIFTALLTVGTFKSSRALQVVFITLTILFFLLSISDLTGSIELRTIGGLEGILCGSSAIYLATAEILNEIYEKEILPV